MRFMGRDDWHASRHQIAEEEILKAVQGVPKPITLMDGNVVEVHPKSFDALLWFREHDYIVQWMSSRAEFFRELYLNDNITEVEVPFTLLMRLDNEVTFQMQLMAYAACQDSVSVNRQEVESEFFNIPPPYDTLDTIDLVRIMQGYWEVNVSRLNLLPYLTGPRKPGSDNKRMGWNVFFSTLAMKLNTDMQPLMHDKPLISLLAQIQLAQPDIEDELKSA
jgi:hypothetical protein